MSEITNQDKHECALREVAMRLRVYPRLVLTKQMTKADADRETAVMKAIAADYAAMVDQEQGKLFG